MYNAQMRTVPGHSRYILSLADRSIALPDRTVVLRIDKRWRDLPAIPHVQDVWSFGFGQPDRKRWRSGALSFMAGSMASAASGEPTISTLAPTWTQLS